MPPRPEREEKNREKPELPQTDPDTSLLPASAAQQRTPDGPRRRQPCEQQHQNKQWRERNIFRTQHVRDGPDQKHQRGRGRDVDNEENPQVRGKNLRRPSQIAGGQHVGQRGQKGINEQTISSTGTAVVNALHVAVTGVADVVIASATAGIS